MRNLSELKPGDRVLVRYYESTVVQMANPGEQPMIARESTERAERGRSGERRVEETNMNGTVTAIDKRASEATLKGPQGNLVTVKFPECLKVATPVHLFSEGIAILE